MIYDVEINFGDQWWRHNGKMHREGDEPAYISESGFKSYWKNGLRHRDGDKPAVIFPDGRVLFFKNGQIYTPTDPHDGKEVEIDGKKYKLTAI